MISIDQRGGPAGGIRGFLNDGTISFRHHAHLDTAAFGHCDYAYRNRGLPSDLQIKYDNNGLEVSIDHKLCFRADKVSLPHDYYLGLTAASSATPDSFEVASFITTTITSQTQTQNQNQNNQNTNQNNNQQQQEPLSIEHIRDALATTLQSSTDQFTDLHTRLQSIGHNTENLFTEYRRSSAALAGRIEELHSKLARYDQLQGVQAQIANLEHAVQELRRSLQSGRGEGAANTANAAATADAERDGRWGVGSYCFVLLLVVGLAVGGFGLWKRRGEDGWKGGKYL